MQKYAPAFAPAVQRALAETLPESVALAAVDLIYGDMSQNPQRVHNPSSKSDALVIDEQGFLPAISPG